MIESIWNGFKRLDFEFNDREAILVIPNKSNQHKNWLLKTEYFGAFCDLEVEMLKRGWHLAFIKNKTRWCLDEDLDLKKEFADFLVNEYNLYKKCIPIGMSCGGLIACKFTAKYPEYVSALYLDAPVMNLLSCPAGLGVASDRMMSEFVKATGITLEKLISYRENPIDKMYKLLNNKIPIILVYGKDDDIVPYKENGELLENYYKANNGVINCIGKDNCGHHPHGLEDNSQIIQFIEKYKL